MLSGLLTSILIAVSAGFILAAGVSYMTREDPSDVTPLEMLEESYTLGEIDNETYVRMRDELEHA
jgi:uncharacterized membrane protein